MHKSPGWSQRTRIRLHYIEVKEARFTLLGSYPHLPNSYRPFQGDIHIRQFSASPQQLLTVPRRRTLICSYPYLPNSCDRSKAVYIIRQLSASPQQMLTVPGRYTLLGSYLHLPNSCCPFRSGIHYSAVIRISPTAVDRSRAVYIIRQ